RSCCSTACCNAHRAVAWPLPPHMRISVCRTQPAASRLVACSTSRRVRPGRDEAMSDAVRYEVSDRIAIATIDNGKGNVLSPAAIEGRDAALNAAEAAGQDEIGALVISGVPGFLSGGFDLSVMLSSPQAAGNLVTNGGAFFTRCFRSDVPVVVACT